MEVSVKYDLKPCPGCEGEADISYSPDGISSFGYCTICLMRGPLASDTISAQILWDDLPRREESIEE